MHCPICGLDKFFIDGVCGICHYDVAATENLEAGIWSEEDF